MFSHVAAAVVVRGRVTDALGKPVSGARVQLIEAGTVEAYSFAGADGSYEIRDANGGRFALLTAGAGFLPAIGEDFYGGATDVLDKDVVLATNTVRQEMSLTATGLATPLPQLTSPVSVIPEDAFAIDSGVVDEMRQSPGAFVVQTGQAGGVTSLSLRGAPSTDNLVLVDGVPAEDVGGVFDYGTLSSTAVGRMELYRGPDSAIYGTDAGAAVVTIDTPQGRSLRPLLTYSGDAGTLHTWRNEATVGGVWQKLDYYGALSRFDTSNAVQLDRYHSVTSAINLGYSFNGNTQMRFTLRNIDAVQGVPGAFDFQGVSTSGRQGDQDLYSGLTLENRYKGWHNLVRYGIARKREQDDEFGNVGIDLGYEYVGHVVTIRGANGYQATGQVTLYNGNNKDEDSNRDQVYYQSDYSFSPHMAALFGFRYDDERGSFNDYYSATAPDHEKIQRTNFEYNLQFQGEFWNRVFYSAGGAVEKNHLFGVGGTPKIGLSYVPVRPSGGYFHGTRFRANAATGVQEPSLALQYSSLYSELLSETPPDTADIAKYHIRPQTAERSRTYDVGVDQNIIGDRLVLKAGYFHDVYDHQIEGVDGLTLTNYFHFTLAQFSIPHFEAYVNSLAQRAQGAEIEIQWRPNAHVFVRGGYTNDSAKVVQSLSSDAIAAQDGTADANPNLPGVPIGIFGPLVGARPFRHAPNTGFFDVEYIRRKFNLMMKGAMASRSDDSTLLEHGDASGGNTLLLPNKDLDFGYVKLDLGGTYAWKHGLTLFAQFDNLLNNQHIGPIGYPGLPLTFRAGVKLSLGGD